MCGRGEGKSRAAGQGHPQIPQAGEPACPVTFHRREIEQGFLARTFSRKADRGARPLSPRRFSPRDVAGTPGVLEQALSGAPVRPGETDPVSVQHIVRSFILCMGLQRTRRRLDGRSDCCGIAG